MPENPVEVIMERLFERLIGEDVYMSHVWSLLSLTVYLVRAVFDENERMAWMVDIEIAMPPETEQVRNGLPRMRKNLKLEEGGKVQSDTEITGGGDNVHFFSIWVGVF
jgi:hypothetical protein